MQRIIKNYYEQLYANKLDNLEEVDKFLETYNVPKLNHEEIKNLNVLITDKEMKTVIKKLSTNKSPEPDGFTGKLHKTKT